MKKKIYFENLDGLRFLCFLSVFFFHSFFSDNASILNSTSYLFVKKGLFANGNLGVNFFFVLSGFLITYLLIEEKNINGRIDIPKFWMRRVLRIWPVYFFCVVFGFYIFPFIKTLFGQTSTETATLPYYISFLSNFEFIKKGLPDASVLGVLWSVAIEEQFYFVWPIVLAFLPVRHYWMVFSAIILSSLIFRWNYDSYLMHEHHTLSCIGDMATGAFAAWLMLVNNKFKSWVSNWNKWWIAILYLLFILVFFKRDILVTESFVLRVFERWLIALVIAGIILEQTFSTKSFFKLGNFKIAKLGQITYGLYCYHFIGILITIKVLSKAGLDQSLWQVLILQTAIALLLSIIIAKLSFRFFEKPFLKLPDRFAFITK